MDLKALYKISYGVYLVSSKMGDKLNGQIATTVFQSTAEPPTVSVCLNKKNLTNDFIRSSRVFTVSILAKDTPLNFIGTFGFKSGREVDKFKGVKYKTGITGAPIVLENAVSYLEVELIDQIDVETHTVFLGKVVDAQVLSDAEPMTYAYYHEVKRGTSPATAPTYVKPVAAPVAKVAGKKYRCTVCEYIYDPEKGDPDAGIKPGTRFEDLPGDWVCPVCGADKSAFVEM